MEKLTLRQMNQRLMMKGLPLYKEQQKQLCAITRKDAVTTFGVTMLVIKELLSNKLLITVGTALGTLADNKAGFGKTFLFTCKCFHAN